MENENVKDTQMIVGNAKDLLNRKSECKILTNITDEIEIFNLENVIDYKINDCKGEKIKIAKYMIKSYEKMVDKIEMDEKGNIIKDENGNPKIVIDKESGEVEQVISRKLVTVLVDTEGYSYVTASKTFAYNLLKLLELRPNIENIMIEIVEVPKGDAGHNALSFKIIQ